MMSKLQSIKAAISSFIADESGQGITEYAAIIAFVATVIALVFAITNGTLAAALSQSFSSVELQLSNLNARASST